MFNFKLEVPTYKTWKAYAEQVQKFYKDLWNDIWIRFPSNTDS